MSKIKFTKMHGCGNDYIYVNAMENDITDLYAATTAWSDRHKGIGSDGLVLIDRATVEGADFSMRIFNADGSEAMMCGNASRCIGKYLYERGLTDKTEIHLQTLSGIKTLRLSVSGGIVESVTVDMLEPAFEDEELFTGCDTPMQGTFVSMGNPHYVIFTNTIDQVAELGPVLERHQAFPQRCNIEFARVEPDGKIRTRVWERGSGETWACGTGACAAVVAAVENGYCKKGQEICVQLLGGNLSIVYTDEAVLMTGNAVTVFEGTVIV